MTTDDATNKTLSTATLNGNLTSLGTAASVNMSFELGLTTIYGNSTDVLVKTTTGDFSINISGLSANTTYHFRAKAVGDGISYGPDREFSTGQTGDIGAEFVYDGDGNRVKKTEGGQTVIYVNKYYEKHLTTGNATSYYYLLNPAQMSPNYLLNIPTFGRQPP